MSHIDQHWLTKKPMENLIDRVKWILEEVLIEITTSKFQVRAIRGEEDNLTIILNFISYEDLEIE